MKFSMIKSLLSVLAVIFLYSCSKDVVDQNTIAAPLPRKVRFELYTDKDFSSDNLPITFTLSIKNSAGKVLWDSTLATFPLSKIPDLAHKLVIEKLVPNDDQSVLKLIFGDYLENVGYYWRLDDCNPSDTLKVFSYNFQ